MLKIRRPLGCLIFNMGIAIPGKTVFLIETAPWSPNHARFYQDIISVRWSRKLDTLIQIQSWLTNVDVVIRLLLPVCFTFFISNKVLWLITGTIHNMWHRQAWPMTSTHIDHSSDTWQSYITVMPTWDPSCYRHLHEAWYYQRNMHGRIFYMRSKSSCT